MKHRCINLRLPTKIAIGSGVQNDGKGARLCKNAGRSRHHATIESRSCCPWISDARAVYCLNQCCAQLARRIVFTQPRATAALAVEGASGVVGRTREPWTIARMAAVRPKLVALILQSRKNNFAADSFRGIGRCKSLRDAARFVPEIAPLAAPMTGEPSVWRRRKSGVWRARYRPTRWARAIAFSCDDCRCRRLIERGEP
jgi:hypothetical protein